MNNTSHHRYTLTAYILLLIIHFAFPYAGQAASGKTGEQLFLANCAKCHGRNGEGFLKLYPPLEKSRFFRSEVNQLPCLIRYGIKGELLVDGQVFNGIMPGNKRITEDEIAQLTEYLQSRWGEKISELKIKDWLDQCPDHK